MRVLDQHRIPQPSSKIKAQHHCYAVVSRSARSGMHRLRRSRAGLPIGWLSRSRDGPGCRVLRSGRPRWHFRGRARPAGDRLPGCCGPPPDRRRSPPRVGAVGRGVLQAQGDGGRACSTALVISSETTSSASSMVSWTTPQPPRTVWARRRAVRAASARCGSGHRGPASARAASRPTAVAVGHGGRCWHMSVPPVLAADRWMDNRADGTGAAAWAARWDGVPVGMNEYWRGMRCVGRRLTGP